MYFENNLVLLINLLKCVQEFNIPVFRILFFLHRIWQSRQDPRYGDHPTQTCRIALWLYQANG